MPSKNALKLRNANKELLVKVQNTQTVKNFQAFLIKDLIIFNLNTYCGHTIHPMWPWLSLMSHQNQPLKRGIKK